LPRGNNGAVAQVAEHGHVRVCQCGECPKQKREEEAEGSERRA
jgi:hypothetical protein